LELQGISLIHNNDPLAVINVYRNQFTPFSILYHLLQSLYGNYKDVIITGDINAHHPWWKCDYENNTGKTISRLIDTHDLVIINRLPTILLPPNIRSSVINLVLISSNLAFSCHSTTDRDAGGSDHFSILPLLAAL